MLIIFSHVNLVLINCVIIEKVEDIYNSYLLIKLLKQMACASINSHFYLGYAVFC